MFSVGNLCKDTDKLNKGDTRSGSWGFLFTWAGGKLRTQGV